MVFLEVNLSEASTLSSLANYRGNLSLDFIIYRLKYCISRKSKETTLSKTVNVVSPLGSYAGKY